MPTTRAGKAQAARSEDTGEAVDEQVGSDAARVIPIVAPFEVARGAPGSLRRRSQPAFPVEVGWLDRSLCRLQPIPYSIVFGIKVVTALEFLEIIDAL